MPISGLGLWPFTFSFSWWLLSRSTVPPVVGLRETLGCWPSWLLLVLSFFLGIIAFQKIWSTSSSSPADCGMVYNSWLDSELYKQVEAEQLLGTTNGGQSTSPPQQNYLHSAPVYSYETPAPTTTQHTMYGEAPMSNDQALDPAELYDADTFQSYIPDSLPSFLNQDIDQRDIHSAAGQRSRNGSFSYFRHAFPYYPSANNLGFSGSDLSESCPITPAQAIRHQEEVHPHPGHPVNDDGSEQPHASEQSPAALLHPFRVSQPDILRADHQRREGMFHYQELSHNDDVSQSQTRCLWITGKGQCAFTAGTVRSVMRHILSCHLREHQQPASRVQCRCGGCSLPSTIRRDSIRRHIREMHYGDKYRRKY
ncbi:uncharacterized protein EDB91DRAFT_1251645 [Suillus paluster]|uniref:uncharacterized protein n=1 Tax=Suillus paluster TaxID=48578 RepID=UPI001B880886|nr:uncharacterized protein EDB91DRAFT_1251645 [Suillus paluster]KAG1732917.1 hypothetical protein EDB91DRAFT_1251645 [Suillus paluster]